MYGVSLARLGRQETCQITRLGWSRQRPNGEVAQWQSGVQIWVQLYSYTAILFWLLTRESWFDSNLPRHMGGVAQWQSAYYKSAQEYAGQQLFFFCMRSTMRRFDSYRHPHFFDNIQEENTLEKNVMCDALQKFIQEHCKSCSDDHCFGPACAQCTGNCPAMSDNSKSSPRDPIMG